MAIYAIITFHTTHFAMKAENVLRGASKKYELIPLPREFSSNCGLCLKVSWEEREATLKLLQNNGIVIHEIHRWEQEDDMEKKFTFV